MKTGHEDRAMKTGRPVAGMRVLTIVLALAGPAALAACTPVVVPEGPPVATPSLSGDRLTVRDGSHLPLSRWQPAGSPQAVVIALHDFGDDRHAFDTLGPWFASRGIAVYAYDQRGFGENRDAGLWPGTQALANDLADAVTAVEQTAPGQRLYLLGEGMGGSVTLAAAARNPLPDVAGIALAAPDVRSGFVTRELYNAGVWTTAHMAPNLGLAVARNDSPTALAPAEAQRLSSDPYVMRAARTDAYLGLAQLASDAADAASGVHLPALVLHGNADDVVATPPTCRLINTLNGQPGSRVAGILYGEMPHLLLQARDQQVVFGDILAWIGGETPPTLARDPSRNAVRACPAGG